MHCVFIQRKVINMNKMTDEQFIKELEKIKTEIDTLRGCYNPHLKERLILESDVMQIIDNHISELKEGD